MLCMRSKAPPLPLSLPRTLHNMRAGDMRAPHSYAHMVMGAAKIDLQIGNHVGFCFHHGSIVF